MDCICATGLEPGKSRISGNNTEDVSDVFVLSDFDSCAGTGPDAKVFNAAKLGSRFGFGSISAGGADAVSAARVGGSIDAITSGAAESAGASGVTDAGLTNVAASSADNDVPEGWDIAASDVFGAVPNVAALIFCAVSDGAAGVACDGVVDGMGSANKSDRSSAPTGCFSPAVEDPFERAGIDDTGVGAGCVLGAELGGAEGLLICVDRAASAGATLKSASCSLPPPFWGGPLGRLACAVPMPGSGGGALCAIGAVSGVSTLERIDARISSMLSSPVLPYWLIRLDLLRPSQFFAIIAYMCWVTLTS